MAITLIPRAVRSRSARTPSAVLRLVDADPCREAPRPPAGGPLMMQWGREVRADGTVVRCCRWVPDPTRR